MESPTDFQVIVAAVAEVQRHVDIGDIHWTDKPGHLLSVSRLPSNRVLVVVYKSTIFQKGETLLFDACSCSGSQKDRPVTTA
jgi:hypothetical protein